MRYQNRKGKVIPGVTTIISANLGWSSRALMHWAWEEGLNRRDYRESKKEAADIGTICHKYVEADIRGKEFRREEFPKKLLTLATPTFEAYHEWKQSVEFQPLESELSLVSEVLQVGGTLDIAAILNRKAIVDIKSSNNVYPDHIIQVAAYGLLWNENFPDDPIEDFYILQLGKDGGFSYHYIARSKIAAGAEVFRLLRRLHCLRKDLK